MKKLLNKRAVITGASDGIGLGIATAFAENGADLILIARNLEKLQKVAAELTKFAVNVKFIAADLSNINNIEDISQKIILEFDEIDILVNNVGVAKFTSFPDVTEIEYNLQLDLNVKAPYLLTQKLLPALEKTKGNIINISSYFAQRVLPNVPSSVYSLTKGAINSWTKALAYELGTKGIRVNAIAPGTVNTSLVRNNINKLSEQEKQKFNESIKTNYPIGRIGEPDDLSPIAVYLASDEAKWVTGSIFNIDGGLTTN